MPSAVENEDGNEYADNSIAFTIGSDTKTTSRKHSNMFFNESVVKDLPIKRRSLKSFDEETDTEYRNIKPIDNIQDAIFTNETSFLKSDFNKISIDEVVNKIKLSRIKRNVAETSDDTNNFSLKESSRNLTEFNNSTLFGGNLINTLLNMNSNKAVNKSSDMDLSEFFMLMSNWFSLLAASDVTNDTTTVRSLTE